MRFLFFLRLGIIIVRQHLRARLLCFSFEVAYIREDLPTLLSVGFLCQREAWGSVSDLRF